jgi:hypothetical protein
MAAAILITWTRNRAYALRLVGDLSDLQMTGQPVPGATLNHPAWILSHLNVYAPIAAALARGDSFADPIDHRYGQKSTVRNDPAEYLPRAELLAQFERHHDEAERAIATADEAVLMQPNPLERWRAMHPRRLDMLVTLTVKHESMHLGQLSAWRRAMNLPRVAM